MRLRPGMAALAGRIVRKPMRRRCGPGLGGPGPHRRAVPVLAEAAASAQRPSGRPHAPGGALGHRPATGGRAADLLGCGSDRSKITEQQKAQATASESWAFQSRLPDSNPRPAHHELSGLGPQASAAVRHVARMAGQGVIRTVTDGGGPLRISRLSRPHLRPARCPTPAPHKLVTTRDLTRQGETKALWRAIGPHPKRKGLRPTFPLVTDPFVRVAAPGFEPG